VKSHHSFSGILSFKDTEKYLVNKDLKFGDKYGSLHEGLG
jgi:hypothetical protein